MADGIDLIVAAALIDTLMFADGRAETDVAGGAGLHALAGAALFETNAVLVTGTGADYVDSFGPWLVRNGLSMEGLRIADLHTPRNLLRYIDERTRTETPVFGAAHFARIEPHPGDIEPLLARTRAAYVFRNADPAFWDGVMALRRRHPFLLLWEIGLDACTPAGRPAIEMLLEQVDAVSLNVEEAGLIFDTEVESRLLERLAGWPVAHVFLRAGGRGSYVISGGAVRFVPSLATMPVDVTGGGNAYSGAALAGLAQGRSALAAAAMGTVAASIAIAQLGLPEPGDPALRARAQAEAAALIERLNKEAAA